MILSAFKLASLAAFGVRNYFGFLTVGRGLGGLFICKQKNFIMYAIYETGVYLPSAGRSYKYSNLGPTGDQTQAPFGWQKS